jgi:hypothetical protein
MGQVEIGLVYGVEDEPKSFKTYSVDLEPLSQSPRVYDRQAEVPQGYMEGTGFASS